MKIKTRVLILALALLLPLTGCNGPEVSVSPPEVIIEHITSDNEISQIFLDALYETGFDLKMDNPKYEKTAKAINLSDGKSLFEHGYLYKSENLKGEEYAYGQNGAIISLNSDDTDDGEIFDTYRLYIDNTLSGISIPLPGTLSFGSTFEQALKDLDIYNAYTSLKNADDSTVELFSENDERLYIYFAGWHGRIVDNSLENAKANLTFIKTRNGSRIFCSLYFSEGKLFACEYSARIKRDAGSTLVSHDKITAHFYQTAINAENISGTIDTIAFTEDSVELTVTIKSTTGAKETLDYSIHGSYSADILGVLGPFPLEADKHEKTRKYTYKADSSSRYNDYFTVYLRLGGLGPFTLDGGRIYYDTNMSR